MDKIKHFIIGAIIAALTTFITYHIMHEVGWWSEAYGKLYVGLIQTTAVAVVATVKELNDNKYDWWDWVATMIPTFPMFIIIIQYF